MLWSEQARAFSEKLSSDQNSVDSRVRIYKNSSFEIKISALISTFELTHKFLEDEGFRAYARDYLSELKTYPRDLNLLGASFPNFLNHHPEATEFSFLTDLARFDFCLHSLYYGLISEEETLFRTSEASSFVIYLMLFDEESDGYHSYKLKREAEQIRIYPFLDTKK